MSPISRSYKSFKTAKKFVKGLKLKSVSEWRMYMNGGLNNLPPIPKDIPRSPNTVYKDEWISFRDWLGTDKKQRMQRDWLNYEDAKSSISNEKIKSRMSYINHVKNFEREEKGGHLPMQPDRVYKNTGWKSWSEFLGIGNYGVKIKKLMSLGMKEQELAKKLDISLASVKRIIDDRNIPRSSTCFAIDSLLESYDLKSHDNNYTNSTIFVKSITSGKKLIRELKNKDVRYSYEHNNNSKSLDAIQKVISKIMGISALEKSKDSKSNMIEYEFDLTKLLIRKDIVTFAHFGGGFLNDEKSSPCTLIWACPRDHKMVTRKGDDFIVEVSLEEFDIATENNSWFNALPNTN